MQVKKIVVLEVLYATQLPVIADAKVSFPASGLVPPGLTIAL